MASGDVTVIGPFKCGDKTAIDTALTAAIVASTDTVVSWVGAGNLVWFAVVET